MNYQKVYQNLIFKATHRPQVLTYTECHHIIPKSLGGSDDATNLVELTAREHFIAHLLLAKIHGGPMIYAAWTMMNANKRKYNNRQYSWVRNEYSKIISEKIRDRNRNNKYMLGKKHSDETKEKISNAQKGNKNREGVKCSNETKYKMSVVASNRTGSKNPNAKTIEATSPTGVKYMILGNISSFAEEHNLERTTIRKMIGGYLPPSNSKYYGWTFKIIK
jgi:hypothetical protein